MRIAVEIDELQPMMDALVQCRELLLAHDRLASIANKDEIISPLTVQVSEAVENLASLLMDAERVDDSS
jgi:hypothetical protein